MSTWYNKLAFSVFRSVSCHTCICVINAGNLHFAYVTVGDMSSSAKYACYIKNTELDVKYPRSYTQLNVTRGAMHKLLFCHFK